METFKAGALAYFDSIHRGAVPCKVVTVKASDVNPDDILVTIKFTATRGWCKRGMTYTSYARHVIPRPFVRFRKYSTTILPGWRWEVGG